MMLGSRIVMPMCMASFVAIILAIVLKNQAAIRLFQRYRE